MSTKPRASRFRIRRAPAAPARPAAAGPAPLPGGEAGAEALFATEDDGFGPGGFATARGPSAGGGAPAGGGTAAEGADTGGADTGDAGAGGAHPAGIAAGGAAPDAGSAGVIAPRGPAIPARSPLSPPDGGAGAEGYTARQLRMARRLALRHGITAASDAEAIRELRARGIDPFQRATLLELVAGEGRAAAEGAGAEGPVFLPQTAPQKAPLPATGFAPQAPTGAVPHPTILEIQRELVARRRRKLLLLLARLAVFVLLPTLLAGWYYSSVATPLYATRSEFVIQQATPQTTGALGGLFSGTALATQQDSITVQSYLQSRDAMLRLDADHGFKAAFSDPSIDPIQRLEPDASNEEAYRLYRRNVRIGYDPTEGIIRMEVIAPDPELSATFSRALIAYAEEQVDKLTQRLREDQMRGARESYEEAEARMLEAQRRVVELQETLKVFSSEVEVSLLTSQISTLEMELTRERLTLEEMLANPSPNRARVAPLERRIESLEREIAALRARLTEDSDAGASLARVQSELLIAQADVATRQMILTQALQQLEAARIEANRQVRYLSLGVAPVPPDDPTYPRVFENTLLVFLIFSGIYLMLSMTASILREQVSS